MIWKVNMKARCAGEKGEPLVSVETAVVAARAAPGDVGVRFPPQPRHGPVVFQRPGEAGTPHGDSQRRRKISGGRKRERDGRDRREADRTDEPEPEPRPPPGPEPAEIAPTAPMAARLPLRASKSGVME
ncbi:hypothetical protein SKAU_G00023810 [Synaphobranchus kaupii]|uniref:Uncharacterized protein n=1 Tax=Synaphobranchus kaupii TaxID=118154 RepID=A0A9Q1GDJ4_SYNKA|nr:hypothetical protein SKAU_G00023810 [Synaphobranchus kaupii]